MHPPPFPNEPRSAHCRVFEITLRHSIFGRTPLDDLYLTTHNTHKRHPCHGGIRIRNPSKRVAADPRLRARGHRHRHRHRKRISVYLSHHRTNFICRIFKKCNKYCNLPCIVLYCIVLYQLLDEIAVLETPLKSFLLLVSFIFWLH
jgi:hypothetical protein